MTAILKRFWITNWIACQNLIWFVTWMYMSIASLAGGYIKEIKTSPNYFCMRRHSFQLSLLAEPKLVVNKVVSKYEHISLTWFILTHKSDKCNNYIKIRVIKSWDRTNLICSNAMGFFCLFVWGFFMVFLTATSKNKKDNVT